MRRSEFSLKTLLYFVPLVVAGIYFWISITPAIHNVGFGSDDNIFWDGLDGWYNFLLTNTVIGWMEQLDTVHPLLFLPLAAIELVCLIIGVVLDLVVSILLIIFGFIWVIIQLIVNIILVLVLPAVVAVGAVVLLVTIDRDQHILLIIFSALSSVLSVMGVIFYYIAFANVYW